MGTQISQHDLPKIFPGPHSPHAGLLPDQLILRGRSSNLGGRSRSFSTVRPLPHESLLSVILAAAALLTSFEHLVCRSSNVRESTDETRREYARDKPPTPPRRRGLTDPVVDVALGAIYVVTAICGLELLHP